LTKGGSFSYYEFTQPMDDRLSDEQWHQWLETGKAPAPPVWTDTFMLNAPLESRKTPGKPPDDK
jgi:hypothetical protein